jgi:hypothetical protein
LRRGDRMIAMQGLKWAMALLGLMVLTVSPWIWQISPAWFWLVGPLLVASMVWLVIEYLRWSQRWGN